ncbi:hypothetical protein [Desulfosoma sp.]
MPLPGEGAPQMPVTSGQGEVSIEGLWAVPSMAGDREEDVHGSPVAETL